MKNELVELSPKIVDWVRTQCKDIFSAEHTKITFHARDAFPRTYYRVHITGGTPVILMVAEPHMTLFNEIVSIGTWMHGQSLPVPNIHAYDHVLRVILFEDFGDTQVAKMFLEDLSENGAQAEKNLYIQMIDSLVLFQKANADDFIQNTTYDNIHIADETMMFLNAFQGLPIKERDSFDRVQRSLIDTFQIQTTVLVHKDYIPANSMIRSDGSLGIIDFQNARIDHPLFDVVSLLADIRRIVHPELEAGMIEYYLDQAQYGSEAVDHDYHVLCLLRNLRIYGRIFELKEYENKPHYWDLYSDRLLYYIRRELDHKANTEMREWVESVPMVSEQVLEGRD